MDDSCSDSADMKLRGASNNLPIGQTECSAKNARIRLAISSFFSSKAKWPASSRWISPSGRSRLNASATGNDERRIVPPPDHQSRRLVLAQPRLPRRVRSDVCPVVVKQIGLDLALAGSRQVGVLVGPGVRVITFGMRGAEGVTLFGCCEDTNASNISGCAFGSAQYRAMPAHWRRGLPYRHWHSG